MKIWLKEKSFKKVFDSRSRCAIVLLLNRPRPNPLKRNGDWATSVRRGITVMRRDAGCLGNKAVSRRGLQVPGTPRDGNGSDAG
jgi:hypothetical protein